MLTQGDLPRVRCPRCRARVEVRRDTALRGDAPGGRLVSGALACAGCGALWPVENGIARLYDEAEVRGTDRLLRAIYDAFAPLHDPAVRYTLPIFQRGTERALRDAYMPRLELGALRPRPDGEPARILEIGVGTGANLPLVRRGLPAGVPAEIWGCDLSLGMLGLLQRRLRRGGGAQGLRLLACDAHALPFPDGAFDRVFHVGALNGNRDPSRALAEMARVATRGTPIVVVDEQLDRAARPGLWNRATFRLVTFYDRDPRCPVEHLPAGATDVVAEQASLFFYCLTFRMPA